MYISISYHNSNKIIISNMNIIYICWCSCRRYLTVPFHWWVGTARKTGRGKGQRARNFWGSTDILVPTTSTMIQLLGSLTPAPKRCNTSSSSTVLQSNINIKDRSNMSAVGVFAYAYISLHIHINNTSWPPQEKKYLFGHLFLNMTNVFCAKKRVGHACICPRMVTA